MWVDFQRVQGAHGSGSVDQGRNGDELEPMVAPMAPCGRTAVPVRNSPGLACALRDPPWGQPHDTSCGPLHVLPAVRAYACPSGGITRCSSRPLRDGFRVLGRRGGSGYAIVVPSVGRIQTLHTLSPTSTLAKKPRAITQADLFLLAWRSRGSLRKRYVLLVPLGFFTAVLGGHRAFESYSPLVRALLTVSSYPPPPQWPQDPRDLAGSISRIQIRLHGMPRGSLGGCDGIETATIPSHRSPRRRRDLRRRTFPSSRRHV